MTNSSDDDSFHSASDGENETTELSSSVSTRTSSLKNLYFQEPTISHSKESNDDFVTIEKQIKVPELPGQRLKKTSSNKFSDLKKEKKSDSNLMTDEDEDDDWFKAQIDEFKKQIPTSSGSSNDSQKLKSNQNLSESEDKKKRSIWDWTGINEVVNAVGEGLSNVVEAGLGLPHAEDVAKLSVAERRKLMEEAQHMKEPEPSLSSDENIGPDHRNMFRQKKNNLRHHQSTKLPSNQYQSASQSLTSVGGFFSAGSDLFTSLLSAPLDALESLGKKTFETLTVKDGIDGDKRRFFLQNDGSDQSLSDLLRELRNEETNLTKKEENKCAETERFNFNFVSLFEKNEGMINLEGLELLSKDQERRTKALTNSRLFDETLLEFCVEDVIECTTDDFENEFAKSVHFISFSFKTDDILETNKSLTQELSLRQAAVDANEEITVDAIHEAAITALAKLTAHSISSLHKIAQLIIIAKNLPDLSSLFAFTYLLCRRLSFFATQYTNILNLLETSNNVDEVVTNVFYECSNACHYVKKALELLRPFFKKS